MKVLSLGSLNVDFNYMVGHITTPKETQASEHMKAFPGGKGLNQAISMSRAGMKVAHAGMIGKDGAVLIKTLEAAGVDTSLIETIDGRTGHAIIQVDHMGQNAILLYGGANRKITTEFIDRALEGYEEGDVLLLQNEISNVGYAIEKAYEKKMFIVLNPSPSNKGLEEYDLQKVSMFFLNEVEGQALSGFIQPGDVLISLSEKYPNSEFVLTLGRHGSFYRGKGSQTYQPAIETRAVDTTAAGDVFEGFFLACYLEGGSPAEALRRASYAAAISVGRPGASLSAPTQEELEEMLKKGFPRLVF